jgi:hypothetical protein
MESSLSVPETKRKRLLFAYDYMGRRVKKAVCGWNPVAELAEDNTPTRTLLWGLDLSGSLQGAGQIRGSDPGQIRVRSGDTLLISFL